MGLVCLLEAANTTESEGCRERGAASVSAAWLAGCVGATGRARRRGLVRGVRWGGVVMVFQAPERKRDGMERVF